MIDFIKSQSRSGLYSVEINNMFGGTLEQKDDGYYDWWPDGRRYGYIPAHVLRTIANKLDELNKEWDEIIKREIR